MRHTVRSLTVGVLTLGLAAIGVAACSKNTGSNGNKGNTDNAKSAFIVDFKGTTPTPAPAVAGAKTGGTISVLEDGAWEHTAGGNIYVSNVLEYSQLFHRTLTQYIESPKAGDPLKLVGDLATNAGVTTDGGKTWTYTLRSGLKYDDGSAVSVKDILYAADLAFGAEGAQGPQYFQQACDPNYGKDNAYTGPEKGAHNPCTTIDESANSITFKFPDVHAEFPYLAEFPTFTPIPAAKYKSLEDYENHWVSEGPYMRDDANTVIGTKLTLKRNPNWDPKTDPIRNAYPDKFVFDFTPDSKTQTERVKAASGDDASALMNDNVPPELIPTIKSDASLKDRSFGTPTVFMNYIYLNTARLTDVKLRQALVYSFDRDAYIKAVGGYDVADPGTTLMAPVVPGWEKYDAYPPADAAGNHGDIDKAKALLGGTTPAKLKFCTANTPTNQKVAGVITQGLERAGFTFTINYIERANYYTTVGVKGTDCDLITGGWGQDYGWRGHPGRPVERFVDQGDG